MNKQLKNRLRDYKHKFYDLLYNISLMSDTTKIEHFDYKYTTDDIILSVI